MEKVMQYIWQWRLYGSPDKLLTDGRELRILHPGNLNRASGPDFFNAKLRMDDAEWAGNVELHLRASDWRRHGHHLDRAYDSVILHVVGENDTYVRRPDGSIIPQLHLPFDRQIAERYSILASDARPLRCRAYIADVPPLFLHEAVDSCAMERLQTKSERVAETLKLTTQDWAHATFVTLARALGFGLNSDPMELLARRLPPSVAAKHSDSDFQLEALLLGSAGLLEESRIADDYSQSLRTEWDFLSHKYNLTPLPSHIWKFSGTRPAASPLRRLVYLARLLRQGSGLLSRLLDARGDIDRLREFFKVKFEGYWASHLSFGAPGTRNYANALGMAHINLLLINAVAPLYYAYGVSHGAFDYQDMAVEMLHHLPAESNSVMRMWESMVAVTPADAWESQGLLQLTRAYCEQGDCLRCRLAYQALRRTKTTKDS